MNTLIRRINKTTTFTIHLEVAEQPQNMTWHINELLNSVSVTPLTAQTNSSTIELPFSTLICFALPWLLVLPIPKLISGFGVLAAANRLGRWSVISHTQAALWTCHFVIVLVTVTWREHRWLRRVLVPEQTSVDDSGSATEDRKEHHFNHKTLKPLIIPSRTTHTRLFPTTHSFSYSYLLVGIPIGWNGKSSSLLEAERETVSNLLPHASKAWFSVEADDFLERAMHTEGLEGKLKDYLRSQSVAPERFSRAYLITAPRFLGFSFNPVSFWYLYTSDLKLAAMILEVNNTFDERRMYYMEADTRPQEDGISKLRAHWQKDFHVSPFNNRDGSYSLVATDPFDRSEVHQSTNIDNTITLKSDSGKPKIIARVFSEGPPIDPSALTWTQSLTFILRWWWVGFMTNPRILKEARTLWSKKLQVFYRPEIRATSIGRQESAEEVVIEKYFHIILETLVQDSRDPSRIAVAYTAAAGPQRTKRRVLRPPRVTQDEHQKCDVLQIKILTPEFYSMLARSDVLTAFERSYLDPLVPDDQHLLTTSDPELLRRFLKVHAESLRQIPDLSKSWLRFHLPEVKEQTEGASSNRASSSGWSFVRAAIRVKLADKIALGIPGLLRFYGRIIFLVLLFSAYRTYKMDGAYSPCLPMDPLKALGWIAAPYAWLILKDEL